MSAQYILPHKALQPYVIRYWKADFHFPAGVCLSQATIPTGHMFFVFFKQEPLTSQRADGVSFTMPMGGICGHLSQWHQIKMQGRIEGFGVHFQPTGFYALFGIPASEFTDIGFDFESVLGTRGKLFMQQMQEASNWQQQVEFIEDFLLRQLLRPHLPGQSLQQALSAIHQTQGKLRVEVLSKSLKTSRRTLARQFNEKVGIPAKLYARTIRINSLLKSIEAEPTLLWMDLVDKFGYYDQSHLINEFTFFTGRRPAELFKRKTAFDDFLLNNSPDYFHSLG